MTELSIRLADLLIIAIMTAAYHVAVFGGGRKPGRVRVNVWRQ